MNNGMTKERYDHITKYLSLLDLDLENGVIRNRPNAKSLSTKGYLRLSLKGKKIMQHQIFAVVRWGEKCIGMTVNHINENKLDNSHSNLELVTNEINTKVRTKAGMGYITPIKAVNLISNEILIFDSQQDAARKLNVSQGNINMVLSGKRKHTKNWFFERKEGE